MTTPMVMTTTDGIDRSVFGEEAAEPDFARLLVGLGIRELSLSPSRADATRQAIRRTDCRQAAELAELPLQCRSPGEVRALLATGLGEAASIDSSETVPESLNQRQ